MTSCIMKIGDGERHWNDLPILFSSNFTRIDEIQKAVDSIEIDGDLRTDLNKLSEDITKKLNDIETTVKEIEKSGGGGGGGSSTNNTYTKTEIDTKITEFNKKIEDVNSNTYSKEEIDSFKDDIADTFESNKPAKYMTIDNNKLIDTNIIGIIRNPTRLNQITNKPIIYRTYELNVDKINSDIYVEYPQDLFSPSSVYELDFNNDAILVETNESIKLIQTDTVASCYSFTTEETNYTGMKYDSGSGYTDSTYTYTNITEYKYSSLDNKYLSSNNPHFKLDVAPNVSIDKTIKLMIPLRLRYSKTAFDDQFIKIDVDKYELIPMNNHHKYNWPLSLLLMTQGHTEECDGVPCIELGRIELTSPTCTIKFELDGFSPVYMDLDESQIPNLNNNSITQVYKDSQKFNKPVDDVNTTINKLNPSRYVTGSSYMYIRLIPVQPDDLSTVKVLLCYGESTSESNRIGLIGSLDNKNLNIDIYD